MAVPAIPTVVFSAFPILSLFQACHAPRACLQFLCLPFLYFTGALIPSFLAYFLFPSSFSSRLCYFLIKPVLALCSLTCVWLAGNISLRCFSPASSINILIFTELLVKINTALGRAEQLLCCAASPDSLQKWWGLEAPGANLC